MRLELQILNTEKIDSPTDADRCTWYSRSKAFEADPCHGLDKDIIDSPIGYKLDRVNLSAEIRSVSEADSYIELLNNIKQGLAR